MMLAPMILTTTPDFQPEKEYCFRVLLGELLGLDYRVVYQEGEKNYRLRLPNGAEVLVEDHFFGKMPDSSAANVYARPEHIPVDAPPFPHPFLPKEQLTALYGTAHFSFENQRAVCGLDVFASTFFMLTRWEEYALPDRDAHGRFPAESSLAARAGFLDRPVVNEWAELLYQLFARLGWEPPRPQRQFRLSLSCDVDHPRLWWSAADRWRTLGGSLFRRKNPRETAFWLRRYALKKEDPYDTFDEIMAAAAQRGQAAHFNFLGARPTTSDCWYPLEHPFVRGLLKKITERGHLVGFHPSYEAFEDPGAFQRELTSLRGVSPQPVLSGRQHYLRFASPRTWRMWEQAGMAWDSTLGYPEQPGFRCGICQDFPVFDFEERKSLIIREKPLIAMDVTLALYRRWSPDRAYDELVKLRRTVEKHEGDFVLLWHNSSLAGWGWEEWKAVWRAFVSV